jgi:trans-aconitate methyltransferase
MEERIKDKFMTSVSPKFYDQAWDQWDHMKIYGPTARHTRRLIFKLLRGLSFNTVLDAGCGTGVLLQRIHRTFPGVHSTGLEYSPHGLDIAQKRLPGSSFHVLNLAEEKLNKQFDLVTCIDVLEHVPDDRSALKNLLEMTAKYLILSVPLGKLIPEEQERMGHVHGYSRRELEQKIQDAGFEILRVIQWGFPFYNIHRRLANRMSQEATTGKYSFRKKLISHLIYLLFYLNIAPGGERYYVLCRPRKSARER